MNHLTLTLALLMALCAEKIYGFSPSGRSFVENSSPLKRCHPSRSPSSQTLFLVSGNEDDDFPPDESMDYSGNVDWDAEWKKVVAKDGKLDSGAERPGKDFYKSEAEIAAIKAANTASNKVSDIGFSVVKAAPDMGSLSGDWKFWIAILALVSVGFSLLTAPTEISAGLANDSFYV